MTDTLQRLDSPLDNAWWNYFDAKEISGGHGSADLRASLVHEMVEDTRNLHKNSRAELLTRANSLTRKDNTLFQLYRSELKKQLTDDILKELTSTYMEKAVDSVNAMEPLVASTVWEGMVVGDDGLMVKQR